MSPRNWLCWLTRHKKVMVVVIVTALIFAWAVVSSVGLVTEANRRDATRRENCAQINALPAKLQRALAVSDRLRQITGPTTTTLPVASLTPEQQAEADRLRAELAELVTALGEPVCVLP